MVGAAPDNVEDPMCADEMRRGESCVWSLVQRRGLLDGI